MKQEFAKNVTDQGLVPLVPTIHLVSRGTMCEWEGPGHSGLCTLSRLGPPPSLPVCPPVRPQFPHLDKEGERLPFLVDFSGGLQGRMPLHNACCLESVPCFVNLLCLCHFSVWNMDVIAFTVKLNSCALFNILEDKEVGKLSFQATVSLRTWCFSLWKCCPDVGRHWLWPDL